MATAPKLDAQAATTDEYVLKAVFLFNFAQFVEWPSQTFSSPDAPIVIGVLGSDPFGPLLDETVRGESVGGRPLTVQRFVRVEEAVDCHVLYISTSESRRLDEIVAHLRGRGILTVSDSERFMVHGVMIRLVTDRNRIRLR
ncbi:MAG TPA: YfiR family protein, partial [Opitutaceae bacterium]|nr:YfiR family protein [Opitutaceae bacterium]